MACFSPTLIASGPKASMPAGSQERVELVAGRAVPVPQHANAEGGGEPSLHPVAELVGGIAVHADDLADLGGRHAVAQLEVEDLGVALAQRLDGLARRAWRSRSRPARRRDPPRGRGGSRRRSLAARRWARNRSPRSPPSSGRRRAGCGFAVGAVVGGVAGDAQEPPAERVGVVELGEAAPRGEEGVLGDLGGRVVVANDAPDEVEDPVEPQVVELAEGAVVAVERSRGPGPCSRARSAARARSRSSGSSWSDSIVPSWTISSSSGSGVGSRRTRGRIHLP